MMEQSTIATHPTSIGRKLAVFGAIAIAWVGLPLGVGVMQGLLEEKFSHPKVEPVKSPGIVVGPQGLPPLPNTNTWQLKQNR